MQEDVAYKLLPCFVLLKLSDKTDAVRFTEIDEIDALPGESMNRGMEITAGINITCLVITYGYVFLRSLQPTIY